MVDQEDDGSSIPDCEKLFRRINPEWIVKDLVSGEERVTTQAFQNYSELNAFSVYLSSFHADPQEIIDEFPGFGVVSFTAGEVRSLQQGVTRIAQDGYDSHAHVNGKKSKSVKRTIVKMANWEVDIRN